MAFKRPKEMISCLSWQYLDLHLPPTVPALPPPLISLISALLDVYYTTIATLNLPAILAFSLPSTLLPTDLLLLSGSTTPPLTIWALIGLLPASVTHQSHLTMTVATTDHCHM